MARGWLPMNSLATPEVRGGGLFMRNILIVPRP